MSCHYTYAKRGTSCYSQTSALTSNEKYFPLNDSVYNKSCSQTMYRYPGYESKWPKHNHHFIKHEKKPFIDTSLKSHEGNIPISKE